MFQIRPMTYHDASVISHWTYPDEFRIYSFEPSEELMAELLDGSYAACFNESKELVGYFCYGRSAQIPTVENFNYSDDYLDIGLGLRPDLCGLGLGKDFLLCGMDYANRTFQTKKLRLSVAGFNRRAISVYLTCGFRPLCAVTLKTNQMPFQIMIR